MADMDIRVTTVI